MKSETVAVPTPLAQDPGKSTADTEAFLWRYLRGKRFENMKFQRRQALGNYVVAFVSLEKKLVIELDGSQQLAAIEKDHERDAWLRKQGFTVLRFWDHEVFKSTPGVLKTIQRQASTPHR